MTHLVSSSFFPVLVNVYIPNLQSMPLFESPRVQPWCMCGFSSPTKDQEYLEAKMEKSDIDIENN
jgi:hypothetical protein